MASFQSSILSAEPIFLDPRAIAAEIIRQAFPPEPEKPKRICCACGCGKPVRIINGKPNRYFSHHALRVAKPRRPSTELNGNAIEILRDAAAGRVQLWASRKASRSGVSWLFAAPTVGLWDADETRRVELGRLKPYLLVSEERSTKRYWVFNIVRGDHVATA